MSKHIPQGGVAPPDDMHVTFAKIIGISARNAVETLHAEGAFSDRQAPELNRRLRGRAYEVLLAVDRRRADAEDDPFENYLRHLAGSRSGNRVYAALRGAMATAVDDFAEADRIAAPAARDLRREATRGALLAFKALVRLHLGHPKVRFHISYWLNMVPSYWESPEVSPEFQRLLDGLTAGASR